jgi:hypothetical protein
MIKFKKGDNVICMQDCSGQGGHVKEGDTGTVEDSYYGIICPACIDFKRRDGSFAHVPSECFSLLI